MNFANLLVIIGIGAQIAVLVALLSRRVHRSLPIFFSYIVWGIAGDSVVLIFRTVAHSDSLYPFEIETYVDSLFQYLVLAELTWSIIRPIKPLRSRGFIASVLIIIAAAALLAWPLSEIKESIAYPRHLLWAFHAQRAFAVLRILFFLFLAGFSQLLRIGWRDRELQVATGLGFYSMVSLAGTLIHSHQSYGWHYYYVDVAIACSYVLSLIYWIFSFSQKRGGTTRDDTRDADVSFGDGRRCPAPKAQPSVANRK